MTVHNDDTKSDRTSSIWSWHRKTALKKMSYNSELHMALFYTLSNRQTLTCIGNTYTPYSHADPMMILNLLASVILLSLHFGKHDERINCVSYAVLLEKVCLSISLSMTISCRFFWKRGNTSHFHNTF